MCDNSNAKENLVPVTIWSMGSDPGYVPSSGWQHVIIVPADKIPAGVCDDPEALFNFAYGATTEEWAVRILTNDLIDSEPYNSRVGACSYSGDTGLVEVPEGCVLINFHYEDISTRDGTLVGAEIVNGKEALAAFYHRRAAHYTSLAYQLCPMVRGGLGPDDEYR